MAATVLESVAVPRPSAATPRVAPPPPPPRMAVTASCRLPLPECRGLRVAARPSRVSSPASFTNTPRRRFRFVCEASETTVGKVPDVTQETWKTEVLESKLPVLVEFWAPWCGPCRMILPVLEELAETYAGKLKCLKLNTDEWPDVASEHGIRSIPTVMLFYGGEKRDSVIGAVPKSTLISHVEKYL